MRFCSLLLFAAVVASAAERVVVVKAGESVQRAVDSIAAGNASRVVIAIEPGVYKERITVPKAKPFVTFRGRDAKTTVLTWNGSAATDGGTGKSASVYIYGDDFAAENITFENSFGTGSQAVALYVNADRVMFTKCRMVAWQDTLYANSGRQIYRDCYIEGHVDFIFGKGTVRFEDCEIHSKAEGYVTAHYRLSADEPTGYVFVNCKLTGENSGRGVYLGRPWRPYGRVVFLDCWLGEHIRAAGWDNWNNAANEQTAWFAEWGSKGPGAKPDARAKWAHTLTAAEAEEWRKWAAW